MKAHHTTLRVLSLLSLLLASRAASAAPHPPAPVTVRDRDKDDRSAAALSEAGRVRFTEAVKLYARKKYDKALAAFIQAYALTGNPAILVNLGVTSLKLHEPLHAAKYLSQYLREAEAGPSDARTRAENALAEARKSLGSVEIVAPEGADVTIDGEAVGLAPFTTPIDVLPGRHTITSATASGAKTELIDAPAGVKTRVRLAAPGPATPPPNAASEPEPRPGEAQHRAPPPPEAPAAPGMLSPPSTTGPVYVAGAVGIVSLTAAIVLNGIGANAARNRAVATDALARNGKGASACTGDVDASLASTCASLASAQRASDAVSTPFLVTVGTGAAALGFALAWYFFAPKETRETREARRLQPRVTADVGARGEPHASFDFAF